MNAEQHYELAEQLLESPNISDAVLVLAEAQVHATLALADLQRIANVFLREIGDQLDGKQFPTTIGVTLQRKARRDARRAAGRV